MPPDPRKNEPRGLKRALLRAPYGLLHLYFRMSRGMTLGARAVVLDGEGRVFLVRHSYVAGWHLPGGGVEVGETLEQALLKELREEALLKPEGRPLLHGVFLNRSATQRDHVAVFVVRRFTVEGERLPDREIREARFFPVGALPEGTTPGTRRRIAEVLEGRAPPEEW